jgi:2-polyprenyl-6-methoxyphenol hydroxylase-like FAD-dependent oxidoreductase
MGFSRAHVAATPADYHHLPGCRSKGWGATGMRVGIIGGSVAGCATAALLHRAGHDVTVFERSESDLVSRGAGIGTPTAVWQDMMARRLIDGTLSACRADYMRMRRRVSLDGTQAH